MTREGKAVALVARLLDPEDLGLSATPEIRDAARRALGYESVEGTLYQMRGACECRGTERCAAIRQPGAEVGLELRRSSGKKDLQQLDNKPHADV